jgi:hypothetical protein
VIFAFKKKTHPQKTMHLKLLDFSFLFMQNFSSEKWAAPLLALPV